jgi:hypothetical protein
MQRMFDDDAPTPEMLPATPENKRRLRKWIRSIEPGGSTHPLEAIQFALSLGPSAVFMLSDGAFASSAKDNLDDMFGENSKAGRLVGQNDRGQAPIHSFAYEDPQAKANMEALAALTGGRYRYIGPSDAQAGAGGAPAGAAPPPAAQADAGRDASAPQTAALAQRRPLAPHQRADAMLKHADQLRAEGKLEEALRAYQELVALFPLTPAGAAARGRLVQMWYTVRMNSRR